MSILEFSPREDLPDLTDIGEMDRDTLLEYRGRLQDAICRLDQREPRNEASEAYDQWADEHEELEDLLDEILDRLDDLPPEAR